jgi:hypothetical protein
MWTFASTFDDFHDLNFHYCLWLADQDSTTRSSGFVGSKLPRSFIAWDDYDSALCGVLGNDLGSY